MAHSFKLFSVALLGLCGACANHNNQPAASSQSVEAASNTPNNGPSFAPASNDGTAAAPADRRAPLSPSDQADQRRPSNAKTVENSQTNDMNQATAPDGVPTGSSTSSSRTMDSNRSSSDAKRSATDSNRSSSDTTADTNNRDNTRVNARDRNGSEPLPIDQGNNQSDLDLTQKIRQAVMKDDSLSFMAKNVKIVTKDGHVTLRGTVKSQAERSSIESAARRVAGTTHVDSQIEVKQ